MGSRVRGSSRSIREVGFLSDLDCHTTEWILPKPWVFSARRYPTQVPAESQGLSVALPTTWGTTWYLGSKNEVMMARSAPILAFYGKLVRSRDGASEVSIGRGQSLKPPAR